MSPETPRVFRDMQSADQIRADMGKNILGRAHEYLGNLYEKGQQLAQGSGLLGGLQDAYRRLFENGFFNKDVFDGRWHWDNQAAQGQGNDAQQKLGEAYDQRAAFYGWDQAQEKDAEHTDDQEQEEAQAQEQDRGEDLER